MSDLIKKIKIKKQDGTYTDYISIGAEAKNIDMKNDYSVQANIGDIDVDNDGNISEQLKKIKEQKYISFSSLGGISGSKINSDDDAILNFNILKDAINKGYNIDIDDNYPLLNNDNTNSIDIDHDIYLRGVTNNAGLYVYKKNHYLYLFNMGRGNLYISKVNFTNSFGYENYLIHNYPTIGQKITYGSVYVEDCYFEGNIRLIWWYGSNSVALDETWGFNKVVVQNCKIYNNAAVFIRIMGIPGKDFVYFLNNYVYNFDCMVIRLSTMLEAEQSETVAKFNTSYIKGVIAKNNYVKNSDDWWLHSSNYGAFIETKSDYAIIENNYIEGLKSNETGCAVYSAYTMCNFVKFINNEVVNCVNFSTNTYNFLMKSKGWYGVRYYLNNIYRIDNNWLNVINNSLSTPYTAEQLEQNTTMQLFEIQASHAKEWKIIGNVIKIPVLTFYSTSQYVDYLYIENNTIQVNKIYGRIFRPDQVCYVYSFCNNIIENNVLSNQLSLFQQQTSGNFNLENCIVKIVGNIFNINNKAFNFISHESRTHFLKNLIIKDNRVKNIYNGNYSDDTRLFINECYYSKNNIVDINNNIIDTDDNTLFYRLFATGQDFNIDNTIIGKVCGPGTSNYNRIQLISDVNYFIEDKTYCIELKFYKNNKLYHQHYYFTYYNNNGILYVRYYNTSGSIVEKAITNSTTFQENVGNAELDGEYNFNIRITSTSANIRMNPLFDDANKHKVQFKIYNID